MADPTPPGLEWMSAVSRLRCPACRVEVVSVSLSPAEMLDRHLRYCSWEPDGLAV